ncbi:MAG: hypothetical protein ACKOAU_13995 [Pirellula sp.]
MPAEQINTTSDITSGRTTSYTEVEPLDEHSVIVMYDRIPNGKNAIPPGSNETNSVWVVKISWEER